MIKGKDVVNSRVLNNVLLCTSRLVSVCARLACLLSIMAVLVLVLGGAGRW